MVKGSLRIEVERHVNKSGSLLAVYKDVLPFEVQHIFSVKSGDGKVRGHHAHRRTHQALFCLSGSIIVSLYDGTEEASITLVDGGAGLLVPPMVWSSQTYSTSDSVLLVLCDHIYDESDYIREMSDFLKLCGGDI